MPRFEPQPTALTQAFWDATREQRYLVQFCQACDRAIYYPRAVCPACLGDSLEWRPARGDGVVYSYNVMHQPGSPFMADKVPYVVALVELPEGARVMTNIVGCDPAEVEIGASVTIDWEPLSDGRHLAVFRLS
jgi:uncharacterized OB-fold protein